MQRTYRHSSARAIAACRRRARARATPTADRRAAPPASAADCARRSTRAGSRRRTGRGRCRSRTRRAPRASRSRAARTRRRSVGEIEPGPSLAAGLEREHEQALLRRLAVGGDAERSSAHAVRARPRHRVQLPRRTPRALADELGERRRRNVESIHVRLRLLEGEEHDVTAGEAGREQTLHRPTSWRARRRSPRRWGGASVNPERGRARYEPPRVRRITRPSPSLRRCASATRTRIAAASRLMRSPGPAGLEDRRRRGWLGGVLDAACIVRGRRATRALVERPRRSSARRWVIARSMWNTPSNQRAPARRTMAIASS